MNREELKQLILSQVQREDGSLNFNALRWTIVDPLLNQIVDLNQFSSNQEKVFAVLNNIDEIQKCFCGQKKIYLGKYNGYSNGCAIHRKKNPISAALRKQTNIEKYGVEHVMHIEETKEKVKQTMLKKYGAEYALQTCEARDKMKQTMLKKYGAEYALQSHVSKEKQRLTNIEKYGVEHVFQASETKNKSKQTNLRKYGVENVFQSLEIQKKQKQTNIEKYGVENVYSSKEIKEKIKQTLQERYNVEFISQSSLIRNKIKHTNLERYGVEHTLQRKEIKDMAYQVLRDNFLKNKLPIYLKSLKDQDIIPLFEPEEYINVQTKYKFRHMTCGKEFMGNFDNGSIPSCPHCKIHGSSKIERKLADDLELTFPQLIRNDRQIIKPKEIDIVIDNIGIEVNGVYWHQADSSFDLLEKSNMSPIQLLHFWDFELYSKYDICLSIIKAKLNHFENKIFARKCDIHYVGSKEADLFFELNHLQGGNVKSSYYLGLYFDDDLVQCISIGKSRFNKNVDLEIHRIATKLNTTIVGGINKLWKQVLTDFPNKKIITYADKRISTGELYKRLGFVEQKDSGPNYFYVKGDVRLARYQCQKHKLPKLLGDKFNPDLTEKENMILDGYIQIKDCGNKSFTLMCC